MRVCLHVCLHVCLILSTMQRLQVQGGGGFHGVEDVRLGYVGRGGGRGVVDHQPSYFIAETLK